MSDTPIVRFPQATQPEGPSGVDLAVQAVSLVVYNTLRGQWLSTRDMASTMNDCLTTISAVLTRDGELRFATSSGELLVNGQRVEQESMFNRTLITQLASISATNFTIMSGFDLDDFAHLVDLLCLLPEEIDEQGGFSAALHAAGLRFVRSKKVTVREITEDETVIGKYELAQAGAAQREQAEADTLAVLTGASTDKSGADSLKAIAADSSRMADLVMKAADQKSGAGDITVNKDAMAGIVVDCLQRAFDELIADPASKTQKGKQAITRTFKELETELLKRMVAAAGDTGTQEVSSAVERMTERLKMDSIAEDYAKKVKALERSEKQILKFMKAQGLSVAKDGELGQKLSNGGLDVTGWHRLLAMSELPGEKDELGVDAVETEKAIIQLANLLSQLDTNARTTGATSDAKARSDNVRGIAKQVKTVTEQTKVRIDKLAEVVNADIDVVDAMEWKAAAEGWGPRVSRRRLLEILAEAIQELCQPLSVVNASIGLVTSGVLGEIPPEQAEMLEMAADSATRIKLITDNLNKVIGMPQTLSPDKSIQDDLHVN